MNSCYHRFSISSLLFRHFLIYVLSPLLSTIALAQEASDNIGKHPASGAEDFGNAETLGLIARRVGDRISLRCQRFELHFSANGKPRSFLLLPEKKELLDRRDPGEGFVVVNRAGETTPLSNLSLSDDGTTLTATVGDAGPQVNFRLNIRQTHIGFQVEGLERFSPVPDLSLMFQMNAGNNVEAVPHNYMVRTKRKGRSLRVEWPTLWTTHKGDDPGGFSIYHFRDTGDKDEMLLRMWSEQPIAHPKVEGDWTYERARAWIETWRERFTPHNGTLVLEGRSLAELRDGLKIAEQAGVSEVYLMPWVWRGEYWPRKKTTAGINTEVFPNGEADLRAFAQEVKAKGMWLGLHWVSAGIGFSDPKYIGKSPDRRLASWGSGTLAAPVDKAAKVLKFRPTAGTYAPYKLPGRDLPSSMNLYPALRHSQDFRAVRVEDELIRFEKIENSDQEVWTLIGCKRGQGSTDAVAHAAGADAAGLIIPYGKNLIPDNSSSLLDDLADAYSSFINRVGAERVEFDGIEIHSYYGGTGLKLAEKIYAGLDHPTTSKTSGGSAPPAWFEYRFSRKSGGHSKKRSFAVVRLRSPSQNAASLLMVDHGLGIAALRGSSTMGLLSGAHGFNVDQFRRHGLHKTILDRMQTWRDIARVLTPKQLRQFNLGTARSPNARLRQAGNHNETSVIYVPEDHGDSWDLYPTAVLNTGQQTSPWYWGQENGPIEPWRFVKAGETHKWTNPFPEQPLRFVLHVLPGTDYAHPENLDIQPEAKQITQTGDTRISQQGETLHFSINNPGNREILNSGNLPLAKKRSKRDHSQHRPIGLFVEGDGNGETLVLQFGKGRVRDYAIPIDFKGRRYVEIPHGEASYALDNWGWYYKASKNFNYSAIRGMSLGFGHVPKRTNANLKISGIKALKEIPAPLVNPVITTANGKLQVVGTIPTDHYLEYLGGNSATLYDPNWNLVSKLPVKNSNFTIPSKTSEISIESPESQIKPWLEVQFLTRGKAINISKQPTK